MIIRFFAWMIPSNALELAKTQGKPRSSGWSKARIRHLASNPTCSVCGTNQSLQVHHIKPFHIYPELELDPMNLITLCESTSHNCHLLIGHGLNWQQWNPLVTNDADYLASMLNRIRSGRIINAG